MNEPTQRAILRVVTSLERAMRALESERADVAWCCIREAQISIARIAVLEQWDVAKTDESMIAVMRCMHGIEIGRRCRTCRGVVGGKGPKPGPGQIWRGRGVGHPYLIVDEPSDVCGVPMVVLFSIDHIDSDDPRSIGESRRGVRWGLADLTDEFWYWGTPAEGLERVAG